MAGPLTLEWSATALADLNRFADFLRDRHPHLARAIAVELMAKAQVIAAHPELGRLIAGRAHYREALLQVLNATYALRYVYDGRRLVMLRVFHGREARD